MDSFTDEDIDLFIKSYEMNLLDNVIINDRIPVWVEFLKTKKYYRINGMDEDYFFKKRFNITTDDLVTINNLIERVRNGKKLCKTNNSNIFGNSFSNKSASNLYSNFNENEQYDESASNKFELLSQVESAMAEYYTKVKKQKQKKLAWKNGNKNYRYQRDLELSGSVNGIPDKYYNKELNQERPQIEYDTLAFAKSPLYNMSKTNIINKIDDVSNQIDYNNLITNDFDTEYKKAIPQITSKKKQTYSNNFDMETINKQLSESDLNLDKNSDPVAQRFWQDQDILNSGSTTRKTCIKNSQPFENQFQYLDDNFNRVMDSRLIGQSSRMDNREYKR